MQQKLYYFVLISYLILLSESFSSNYQKTENYKAYLTVSFQNPALFQDSSSQSSIKSNIEKVFEKEGIHIIHEENRKNMNYQLMLL